MLDRARMRVAHPPSETKEVKEETERLRVLIRQGEAHLREQQQFFLEQLRKLTNLTTHYRNFEDRQGEYGRLQGLDLLDMEVDFDWQQWLRDPDYIRAGPPTRYEMYLDTTSPYNDPMADSSTPSEIEE